MTQEQLKKANKIVEQIKDAEKVLQIFPTNKIENINSFEFTIKMEVGSNKTVNISKYNFRDVIKLSEIMCKHLETFLDAVVDDIESEIIHELNEELKAL